MLINFVSNALKFTSKGGKVTVSLNSQISKIGEAQVPAFLKN